jgi:hypothetical protein
MKCFDGTTVGIGVTKDDKLGEVVLLGEHGRGRKLTKVKLDTRSRPVVRESRVVDADISAFSPPPKEPHDSPPTYYVLKAPRQGADTRATVRVCTKGTYTRDTHGQSSALVGEPKSTAEGRGAHGDAGRIGSWSDTIWIMSPGDVIHVQPEGGYKTEPYVLTYDGHNVTKQSYEDFLVEVTQASPERKAELRRWAEKYGSKRLLAACAAKEVTL